MIKHILLWTVDLSCHICTHSHSHTHSVCVAMPLDTCAINRILFSMDPKHTLTGFYSMYRKLYLPNIYYSSENRNCLGIIYRSIQ